MRVCVIQACGLEGTGLVALGSSSGPWGSHGQEEQMGHNVREMVLLTQEDNCNRKDRLVQCSPPELPQLSGTEVGCRKADQRLMSSGH